MRKEENGKMANEEFQASFNDTRTSQDARAHRI